MSAIRIADAAGAWIERWDEHIERSVNGTLFHLRRFLAYHGELFRGSERFLLVLDGDTVIAQIPVAIVDDQTGRRLRSPYGASYGGFAFQRYPTFTQARRVVEAFLAWSEDEKVTQVTITPPMAACSALPLDVVHFALLDGGFRSVNRDVSSVVPLDRDVAVEAAVASRTRQNARKALRRGVTIDPRGAIEDFWSVMDATFERHGTPPTHTLEEFRRLADAFPDRVYVDVGYYDGQPVAGVGYFVTNRLVNSSFYLCQRPDQRQLNGLTLCILRGLERAQGDGYRWFDLGTSTVRMQPRESVFRFKEQFASVGQFRETFEWTAGGHDG
jgi:GNAT acetyltransferase-like protein